MVRGGGPGGPVPYRVFIDSGVVLLCVVALAPASPLLSPFALVHFLYSEPLLRRNIIFMYRPKFDGGGIRWPFLFEMVISSLCFGHVLMVAMLVLKRAIGPAIIAAIPFVPTLVFRHELRKQYLKAYQDAGLVQTSMLDGWDNREPTSVSVAKCVCRRSGTMSKHNLLLFYNVQMKKREDFRRFLVDAHKASYVPVCIAGSKDIMTAEPAVVIHSDDDEGDPSTFLPKVTREASASLASGSSAWSHGSQFGVAMRRVTPRNLERMKSTRHFDFSENGSMHFSSSAVDPIDENRNVSFTQPVQEVDINNL